MKIFVLGNINAGKSYFINKLKNIFPEYEVMQIDNWRMAHGDGSIEKEEEIWEQFPRAVLEKENVIVEFCGGGIVAQNMINGLDDKSCMVLKLCTDIKTCLSRMKEKDYSAIPYPTYPGAGDIGDTISCIGIQMENGSIEETWGGKAICILPVTSETSPEDLPLRQYEKIGKIKKLYQNEACDLFLFGSAARKSMTKYSDVDIFLRSNLSVNAQYLFLKNHFETCSIMGNEVVVRENGVLIEVDCITNLDEAELFYRTSGITDIEASILIGDEKLLLTLKKYAKKSNNFEAELHYTVERLKYYVLSLPSLIWKKDEYKYYFHSNIVIHEYVRLKAFLMGNFEHSYLPRQAKKYLKDAEWEELMYNYEKNPEEHYQSVKILTDQLLEEVQARWGL